MKAIVVVCLYLLYTLLDRRKISYESLSDSARRLWKNWAFVEDVK